MIAAYLYRSDRPIAPDLVRRFTASLGIGVPRPVRQQVRDGVLLASHGAAPVLLGDGRLVCFDGYLDNRQALRLELGAEHGDDAALYAAGLARWGDTIDLRAIGQFASIVVDPEARSIRAARSPIMAAPLHLWCDAERVMIASTPRVLFATGEVNAAIDEQKIADSLYLNYNDGAHGWYKGVERIERGTRTVITRTDRQTRRYYDPAALPDVRLRCDSDYVAAADALLMEATRAALDGVERPVVSLSGGLDSQAVASCAIRVLGPDRPLLGLTGVPEPDWDGIDHPTRFGDERTHVAALAAMYPSLETESVDAAGQSFDHKLAAMFLMAGAAPRNAMNLHWIHALRARAKARGGDMLLLGSMGNFTFSFDGTGALPSWLARGRWLRLAREIAAGRGDTPFLRQLASKAVSPLIPPNLYRPWARLRSHRDSAGLPAWCPLDPDYARDLHVAARAEQTGHGITAREFRSTRAFRIAALGGALNEGGDTRQAMDLIGGIPSRDPTAYRPLVEFCLGIPDDQFLRAGQRRWLARRMLQNRVPEMVRTETRRGDQAADNMMRLTRDADALIAELAALGDDAAMARRFDLPRLNAAITQAASGATLDRPIREMVQLGLPRALATARFIRFVEGSNA